MHNGPLRCSFKNQLNFEKITAEWKSKQVIEQWNVNSSNDAAAREIFKIELKRTENRNIINATCSFQYYKRLEKQFEELVTEDRIFQYKAEREARKTLQQR